MYRKTSDMQNDEPPADTGSTPERREGTPTWVKVAGAIAVAVIVGLIVLLVVGDNHGPGRHAPSGDSTEEVDPTDHRPPSDAHR